MNASWRSLHDELGIGAIETGKLRLAPADHEKLRSWITLETSADPLVTDIKGGRLEVASQVSNEKWAIEGVFSDLMQVNVRSGEVPLKQGDAVTPPDTLLSITPDDLAIDRIKSVVIVENGIIARHWHKCRIPADLDDSIMVYRGHDANATVVKRWIKSISSNITAIGYFDFDPAGLGLAIDYQVNGILIPDPLDDEFFEQSKNKTDLYHDQLLQRPNIDSQLPENLMKVWQYMTDRKCAVTQERITAMKWGLKTVALAAV